MAGTIRVAAGTLAGRQLEARFGKPAIQRGIGSVQAHYNQVTISGQVLNSQILHNKEIDEKRAVKLAQRKLKASSK